MHNKVARIALNQKLNSGICRWNGRYSSAFLVGKIGPCVSGSVCRIGKRETKAYTRLVSSAFSLVIHGNYHLPGGLKTQGSYLVSRYPVHMPR